VRAAGIFLVAFLSAGIAIYAVVAYGFLPLGALVHPEIRASFEARPFGIYTHAFAASVALALGPLQFWRRLRESRPAWHRWTGRIYLGVGVLVGGLAGLYMAPHAYGGPVAGLGFGGLALAWLYSGFRAYGAIRAGDVVAHRQWMTRNFALTFAAVMLRLWLPAFMASGVSFEAAYVVIAWLCWVPNLLVAEWLVTRRAARAPAG